jgi:hypothetical protein
MTEKKGGFALLAIGAIALLVAALSKKNVPEPVPPEPVPPEPVPPEPVPPEPIPPEPIPPEPIPPEPIPPEPIPPVANIVYSDQKANSYLYNPEITAWSCVNYQVTIRNNTNQDVTIGYNVHIKAYKTTTPDTVKYDFILAGQWQNGMMQPDTRYPVFYATIPANTSVTQTFNMSPYQVQLQLGDTMELNLIDFNGGFSQNNVEANGTETPVAKVSM